MKFILDDAVLFAITEAMRSPCQSKRGVVIWDDKGLISSGHNHQLKPFVCDGSRDCKRSCGKTAIHAEQAAILTADKIRLRGSSMLHIKVSEDGYPLVSMGPSCHECSKLILAVGVQRMWLLHDKGWVAYNAPQFHFLSCGSGSHLVTRKPASAG